MTVVAMSGLTAANVYFALTGDEPAFSWASAVFCGLITVAWIVQSAARSRGAA